MGPLNSQVGMADALCELASHCPHDLFVLGHEYSLAEEMKNKVTCKEGTKEETQPRTLKRPLKKKKCAYLYIWHLGASPPSPLSYKERIGQ